MSDLPGIYTLPPARPDIRIGGPIAISTSAHALLLFLLFTLAHQLALKPPEPLKVLEINVMGKENRALKGNGTNYSAGPLPAPAPLARPAKRMEKAAPGNTTRISRALAPSAPKAPPAPPALSSKGPLFSADKSLAESGVGREKIYISAPVKFRPQKDPGPKSGPGQGLVGVSGAPIDLTAKRGVESDGRSNYLSGGAGSADGGLSLSRLGQPIIVKPVSGDDPVLSSRKHSVRLEAPSDDFFSISGPLSGRKILRMTPPKYPRWAEEQGLEARIAVRITVNARGRVKPDIILEQTSGFPEFDNVVLEVVRNMAFAPLSFEGGGLDQWGIAAFNFRLKKGTGN